MCDKESTILQDPVAIIYGDDDTRRYKIVLTEGRTDTPIDITSYIIKSSIAKTLDKNPEVLVPDTAITITILNQTTNKGMFEVNIPRTATVNLELWDKKKIQYFHDIQVIDGSSKKQTFAQGTYRLTGQANIT